MFRWILAAIAIAGISAAVSAAYMHTSAADPVRWNAAQYELNRRISTQYERVSLVSLLADPERYDGRKVRVAGFVTLGFEDVGLHRDEATYEAGIPKNTIWLDIPAWLTSAKARQFNHRYGEVTGTFQATRPGLSDIYSGALVELRSIDPNLTRSDLAKIKLRESHEVLMQSVLSGGFLTLMGWTALGLTWIVVRRKS